MIKTAKETLVKQPCRTALILVAASLAIHSVALAQTEATKVADVTLPMAVSPSGQLILALGPNASLALLDVASGETRSLTSPSLPQLVMNAIFSPTGAQVAYSWHNEEDFDELRIIDVAGSGLVKRYRDPTVRSLWIKDWSPDEEQILVVLLKYDSTIQIVSLPVAGGPPSILAVMDPSADLLPGRMAYSPDGSRVAYDAAPRRGALAHDLFVMASDGTGISTVVEHPSDDRLLDWSPDGSEILFASDRDGTVDIWRISEGEHETWETPERHRVNVGQMLPLGITAEGGYYYGTAHCECHVYASAVDAASGTLTGSPEKIGGALHNSGADWSPDGQSIAYVAPPEGVVPADLTVDGRTAWSLRVRTLGTGLERSFYPAVDRLHQLRPRWSPDGRSILVKGWDRIRYPQIVASAVDVETGTHTAVLTEESLWRRMVDWVGWHGTRDTISYVDLATDGTTSIILRHVTDDDDEERVLYRVPVPPYLYGLTTSPDRQHLAFGLWDTRAKTSSLAIMPVSTGKVRILVELALPAIVSPPAWHPNSVELLYEAQQQLWRVSVDSNVSESLGSYAPLIANQAGITIHPDGTRIAFVAERGRSSGVWFIPNLALMESEGPGSFSGSAESAESAAPR